MRITIKAINGKVVVFEPENSVEYSFDSLEQAEGLLDELFDHEPWEVEQDIENDGWIAYTPYLEEG